MVSIGMAKLISEMSVYYFYSHSIITLSFVCCFSHKLLFKDGDDNNEEFVTMCLMITEQSSICTMNLAANEGKLPFLYTHEKQQRKAELSLSCGK